MFTYISITKEDVDVNHTILGTTGKPKGVTLSHHNVVNNAHQIGHRIGYNEKVIEIGSFQVMQD